MWGGGIGLVDPASGPVLENLLDEGAVGLVGVERGGEVVWGAGGLQGCGIGFVQGLLLLMKPPSVTLFSEPISMRQPRCRCCRNHSADRVLQPNSARVLANVDT